MEITWRVQHTRRLRSAVVGWDGTEVGAPCFPPDWDTQPDDVHLLRIATGYGTCPPGSYPYRRPPEDVEFSPYVQGLAEENRFEFTDEHRTLLTAMSWELTDPYDVEDIPGADPKRPYGDFTFYQLEMALHLGLIPAQKPADYDPMTPEIIDAMTQLHAQMQPALQVYLENFDMATGRVFVGEEWGGWTEVAA
ncbi:MAG: hypothetical protein PGN37_04975 [Mycobacterium kyogaense]|uniref:hypothetical protein n=1 Tax=Mycobacterium kyogaense TaxID=2212479 RepID=UPI002FFB9CCD